MEYLTNMPNEYVYGNGGLLTTTEDLVKWNEFYSANKLGTAGLLSKQLALGKFNNGTDRFYSAGLFQQKFRGEELWTHDGATASYRSNLDLFPELGLSIAFLSNSSEFDRDTLQPHIELRRLFLSLPHSTNPTTTAAPPFAVSKDKLATYQGWYRNTKTGAATGLTLKDSVLVTNNNSRLKPVAENVFTSGSNRIVFLPGNKSLYFIEGSVDTTLYMAEPAAAINEANINDYTGKYYSEETESKIWLVAKDGKLFLRIKPADNIPLTPTFKDGFITPFGPVVFKRTDSKLQTFFISVSRARNVKFVKIP
jgi:hypothetical protein